MSTRYRYATTLRFGNDEDPGYTELEAEVSYTVAWGSPGTGRPYYGPVELYDEGSPDEVEDLRLELVENKPPPFIGLYVDGQEMEAMILQQIAQDHTDNMIQEARDRETAWADAAADYRALYMREDRP